MGQYNYIAMNRAIEDSSGVFLFEDLESKNILLSRQEGSLPPAQIINFGMVCFKV